MSNLIISLVIALAGFFAGWQTNGWRLGLEIQTIHATHAQEDAARTTAVLEQRAKLSKERDALADKLAALDAEYTTQLTKVRHDNQTLRDRLAAGTTGLRIEATCPQSGAGSPQAAQGGSVDPPAGAELSAAAGQTYTALRENIITTEVTLAVCQNALARFQ